ncbi:MAG: hypothetical protein LBR23_04385 [Spirochaetaceae bacterium]|jgi:hypothetical protein|nr:hypothetical protein [Spirochaetaceae bacterium]
MEPKEQKTLEVLERIYRFLLTVKWNKTITYYAHDCFTFGFGMPYSNDFTYLIQGRKGVNNIPALLGAIGFACRDKGLPPLCCLVVDQDTKECGKGVVTSKEVPEEEKPAFARDVDRPAAYACEDYPQPGTQTAADLLDSAMVYLRKEGIVRE